MRGKGASVTANKAVEVPASLKLTRAEDVAGAILAAYANVRASAPANKEAWLWPLALSANETASWSQLYNWNLGNVTTDGSVPWYRNPHVTSGLKFRDCLSLGEGALVMLRALDRLGGLDAAAKADYPAFQKALNAYLGSGTYPSLAALIAKYENVTPTPPSS